MTILCRLILYLEGYRIYRELFLNCFYFPTPYDILTVREWFPKEFNSWGE